MKEFDWADPRIHVKRNEELEQSVRNGLVFSKDSQKKRAKILRQLERVKKRYQKLEKIWEEEGFFE